MTDSQPSLESNPQWDQQRDRSDEGLAGETPGAVLSCPVELNTVAQGRQREVCASIQIPGSVDPVWRVLTSYERLDEIIPSLSVSRRLPHPDGETKIRLEQVGSQTFFKKMNFSARVVLDMEEEYPHKIHFVMVEGDFKMMKGHWMLESIELEGKPYTRLSYCLSILPKLTMPIKLVESRLHQDLKTNMEAIYRQVVEAQSSDGALGGALSPA